jgi:hypothetical protein
MSSGAASAQTHPKPSSLLDQPRRVALLHAKVGYLSAAAEHRHDGRVVLEAVRWAARRATMDACGD